jgi:hypothetical protein
MKISSMLVFSILAAAAQAVSAQEPSPAAVHKARPARPAPPARTTTNAPRLLGPPVRQNAGFQSTQYHQGQPYRPDTAAMARFNAARQARYSGAINRPSAPTQTINPSIAPNVTANRNAVNATRIWQSGDVRTGTWQGQNRQRNNGGTWAGNWQGSNNAWRHGRHQHDWWRSRYNQFALFGGGYYYWDNNYWYPAYGYDQAYDAYSYDGPIYGYDGLPPGQVVGNVQAALQEQGYYRGAVDGTMGPMTREAIANFQRDHGLAITTAIDEPTLRSLGLV